MSKMKDLVMSNEDEVTEATKDLIKDTKELVHDHFENEVDEQTIKKVVAAIFEGILSVFKKF